MPGEEQACALKMSVHLQHLDQFVPVHAASTGSYGKAERQPWDVGRFAKTIGFFNKPPSLQQMLQSVLVDAPAKLIRQALGVPVQEAPLVLSVPAAAASSAALSAEAVVPVDLEGVIMVTGEQPCCHQSEASVAPSEPCLTAHPVPPRSLQAPLEEWASA